MAVLVRMAHAEEYATVSGSGFSFEFTCGLWTVLSIEEFNLFVFLFVLFVLILLYGFLDE